MNKVKVYLRKYRRMTEALREIDNEIAQLEAEIGRVSISEGGVSSGAVQKPTEAVALKLAEIKTRREEMRRETWTKREEIENVILMCDDPIKGRLLYDRYILGHGWAEITASLHYSDESHVRGRLHSAALASIERWIPEDF